MLLTPELRRRVLFFGGKGGVGKTTLAAAAALESADRGVRTLLVSTDAAHSTGDILGQQLGPEPRPVVERLAALEIDPRRERDAYIADVERRLADATPPRLAAEVQRQVDLARVSPGAEEAAVFERFARILEGAAGDYDRLVFDTAPTGQTLRLLSLPEHLSAWVQGLIGRRRSLNTAARAWRRLAGAAAGSDGDPGDPLLEALEDRHRRFVGARAALTDPERSGFVFVLVPERLPILETDRAVTVLERHGIPVAGVLVNRVLPDAEVAGGAGHGADRGFLERRRARQAERLTEVEARFAGRILGRVRLRDSDPVGLEALRELAYDPGGGAPAGLRGGGTAGGEGRG